MGKSKEFPGVELESLEVLSLFLSLSLHPPLTFQKHARVLANDKGNFTSFKFNLPGVAIKQAADKKQHRTE